VKRQKERESAEDEGQSVICLSRSCQPPSAAEQKRFQKGVLCGVSRARETRNQEEIRWGLDPGDKETSRRDGRLDYFRAELGRQCEAKQRQALGWRMVSLERQGGGGIVIKHASGHRRWWRDRR
jgi:hypothetical protein